MKYQPIIGLEIHVQLKTKSKMFCGCDNRGEDASPNTTICPVCTAQPGALPVINDRALRAGILMGLALGCRIPEYAKFDRKNYFYPDSPKGYQISQFDLPIAVAGSLSVEIPTATALRPIAKIGITRAHLEDDAAKLIHATNGTSLVDFNRAGTPLIEIVTEPDFRTPEEAKFFLQELQRIARYLDVSDADMEKGNMRCDANISLLRIDDDGTPIDTVFNPKIEVKNINSFRSVERALEYEIKRQSKLFDMNTPPASSSTRGWNDDKGVTEDQRTKEGAHDYRYFPEPDLPPLKPSLIAEEMRPLLPELPAARRLRFKDEFGLSNGDIAILTDVPAWADFTEQVFSEVRAWLASSGEIEGTDADISEVMKTKVAKLVGGWLTSKLMGEMAARSIDIRILKITPENFAEFISLIYGNKINSTAAREILGTMLESGEDPSQIMEDRGLGQMENTNELQPVIESVIAENGGEVTRFKAGEEKVIKFLIGIVMKKTQGRVNPQIAEKMLRQLMK